MKTVTHTLHFLPPKPPFCVCSACREIQIILLHAKTFCLQNEIKVVKIETKIVLEKVFCFVLSRIHRHKNFKGLSSLLFDRMTRFLGHIKYLVIWFWPYWSEVFCYSIPIGVFYKQSSTVENLIKSLMASGAKKPKDNLSFLFQIVGLIIATKKIRFYSFEQGLDVLSWKIFWNMY